MSSSLSNRFKAGTTIQQSESVQSMFTGHHATVHCHECNRIMVPRVVSYYGQPLKSVCPFCGATFTKFQSGFGRLFRLFQTRTLSFSVFFGLATAILGFGLIGLLSSKGVLSNNSGHIALFGTVIFGLLALPELAFQCIEQLAAKLDHESNYYWAILVVLAMILIHQIPEWTGYVVIAFTVMLIRGLLSGVLQLFKTRGKGLVSN
ncbi:hypothetical protein PL263_20300 [Methylomonas sp. EFPC3]|uniref:hypothetical protein n=1 Tax=Methylomonas sp. EFPC3 TaxID=3021710 RepID=UPI002416E228|nr:hypothetical protein [Methylomonas sp. EFPC3]WFP50417.1 hypothetical protein PL263_20300 [Methylomonas sp. EFPC3]